MRASRQNISPGSFTNPTQISIDSNDNVYVADLGSPDSAVQKFTSNGTFIKLCVSTGIGAWSIPSLLARSITFFSARTETSLAVISNMDS